jgi:hypothetical protein
MTFFLSDAKVRNILKLTLLHAGMSKMSDGDIYLESFIFFKKISVIFFFFFSKYHVILRPMC